MIITLDHVLVLLTTYKYILLFPIAVIEGPIISIISGFLISIGIFNPLFAYIVLVAGDVVGDTMYYAIGRFGGTRFIRRWGSLLGIQERTLLKAEDTFKRHGSKLYLFGKVQGLGSLILIAAGATKMPYPRFIWLNTLITLVKTFVLVIIGYYFGYAYAAIDSYMTRVAIISTFIIIIGIIAYYLNRSKKL